MSNEATAIRDLLDGLNRKPLQDDPDDDWLFAGSHRTAKGTEPPPFSAVRSIPRPELVLPEVAPLSPPPPVVTLPRPFVHTPAAALAPVAAGAAVRVPRTRPRASTKLYAIPAALAAAVGVLLAIYLAGDDAQPTTASAAPTGVTRIKAPTVAPTVTPIVDAPEPVVAVASAPEVVATPSATAEPVVAAPEPAPAPISEGVVPASAFIARPTMPTVTTPTVPAAAAPPEDSLIAAADDAPVTETPTPAKVKKSRREIAREKRAAKRAATRNKREAAAKKPIARAERTVARVEELGGKGALSITSAQPREVWVDGRNTKRMAPLRVLVRPGKHKVTLYDKARGTAKTYDIEVKANETAKLAR